MNISVGQKTILVLSDDVNTVDLIDDFLSKRGYTIIVAKNGQQAVDIYREHFNTILIVILEIHRSGNDRIGSGKEVYLLNGKEMYLLNPDIRIILMSDFVENDDEYRNIFWLKKPFTTYELIEAIDYVTWLEGVNTISVKPKPVVDDFFERILMRSKR